MTEAAQSVLQLEGTIRGGPNDMIDSQECDENSSDCMDIMMNFGSESLSEMMPNMDSILTMPKTTPPPTISELFCPGSNSSPDDDFDQLAGQAWYAGGAMASKYLDGDGSLDDLEPAAKRSASATPIGGQLPAKQRPYGCQDSNRDAAGAEGAKGPRASNDGPPGAASVTEDVYDVRHKRKLADRGDMPRVSGLHLHPKNGALFSKSGRSSDDSDEIVGDPMRVYRKTIMALGRENFFLKQQFGTANSQVVHLSRQLAVATEENQKLRSIVGKLGLGRSFGADGAGGLSGRFRGVEDSFLAARLDDDHLRRRPRHDSPPAHCHPGPGLRGAPFDAPTHPHNLPPPLQAHAHRRNPPAEDPAAALHARHRRAMHSGAWTGGLSEEDPPERWRRRPQHDARGLPDDPGPGPAAAAAGRGAGDGSAASGRSCASGGGGGGQERARRRGSDDGEAAGDKGSPKGSTAGSKGGEGGGGGGSANGSDKMESTAGSAEGEGEESARQERRGERSPKARAKEEERPSPLELGGASDGGGKEGKGSKGSDSATSTPKGGEGRDKGGKSKGGAQGKDGQQQPRFWTKEEHARFLDAVRMYGYGNAREIAAYVQTRSITQVRTHAQKYILKLSKIGSQQSKDDKDRVDPATGAPARPGLDAPPGARSLDGDDQSLSFLGDKDEPFRFAAPSPHAMARMHLDPYPFHSASPGAFSMGRGGPGEDDPSVAATWIENMELSGPYMGRGPHR